MSLSLCFVLRQQFTLLLAAVCSLGTEKMQLSFLFSPMPKNVVVGNNVVDDKGDRKTKNSTKNKNPNETY